MYMKFGKIYSNFFSTIECSGFHDIKCDVYYLCTVHSVQCTDRL